MDWFHILSFQMQSMANKPIIMNKIKQIIRYHVSGLGSKKISSLTGVSRNVVKQYIRLFASIDQPIESLEKLDERALYELFHPFKNHQVLPDTSRFHRLSEVLPQVIKDLRKRGVTLDKVWRSYIEKDPAGYGRSQFYYYITEFRNRNGITMHIEHKAGDKLFVDFCGEKLKIVDPSTGEEKSVEVFVAILGCSQLTYVEATMSQTLHDFIDCCRNSFEFIGGVTRAIVPDNLKAAVTKSSKHEPIINETFGSFAEHYNTSVLPTRAYKPKDKALVENAVRLVYQRIFTEIDGKHYTSLESLNKAIKIALEKHNNAPLKNADSRRVIFEREEKQTLHALPLLPYHAYRIKEYRVMKNGYVTLHEDRHYYSVPYNYIGRRVKILYNSLSVKVYYQHLLVATHERNYNKNRYTTDQEHLATQHKFLTEWNPEYFVSQAKAISEDVVLFIERLMESKTHPEMAYKACSGVLSLAKRMGNERLTNACKKAIRLGVYHYHFIEELLKKNIENENVDEWDQMKPTPSHKNVRGKEYYESTTLFN